MQIILTYLKDIWDNIINIILTMGIFDYLDILLMSFLIYQLLKFVRETRAEQLLRGILAVFVILLIIRQFNTMGETEYLRVFGFLSDTFFSVGLMAVIVMFQPELRRVLEKMGRAKVVPSLRMNNDGGSYDMRAQVEASIEQIAVACEKFSRTATGALIVMERTTKLGEQAETGIVLKAMPTAELLGNIFFPNSPLHDGAVIIRDGMVLAAGCFLPKPQKEEIISKDLGTRHRAAIGMSEISDAIIIVVSEETGIISLAENGRLSRGHDTAALTKRLSDTILKDAESHTARPKRPKKNRTVEVAESDK
ncbi:MAG: diadenylate cyclase CdaA [Oscillospiraceae bacterium]|nr:diadenylate cyclase CdaA [Oscillospiraceae bacterium]